MDELCTVERESIVTTNPDGPPRDWPSIWRQQLREHIERAPMIPREYVEQALEMMDLMNVFMACELIPPYVKEDEVKP